MRAPTSKEALAASLGAACCALLLAKLPVLEGEVRVGYKDPIGIVTACVGHTKTAELGRPYTEEECEKLLVSDLTEHVAGVRGCLDQQRWENLSTGERAAVISFAFNAGVGNFCASTMRRKIDAGSEFCPELDRWTRVTYQGKKRDCRDDDMKRICGGIVERRKIERAMCEGRIG